MKRCIKEEIVVEEVKHKGSAVKKGEAYYIGNHNYF